MARRIPIDDCQPSQLLLSAKKLRGVLEWADPDEFAPDPVLVLPAADVPRIDATAVDAPYVVIDGHTRAFVAHCCGVDTLESRIEDASDVERNALEIYAHCVEWCLEESITTPADFAGRVVSHETYLEEWVGRCHDLESVLWSEDEDERGSERGVEVGGDTDDEDGDVT
ncbi:histone acetyltransferase [Natronoglomus mannanivorans]|uniref:Histone acetyltransferase n=1 Tax=Natronoglomus mannanivorans TaxID=2979990 RepID=A0AAP2YZ71_9EURY|nr:histone acetyltransferase [Halobacteria archaeon AArc-xg1-1]